MPCSHDQWLRHQQKEAVVDEARPDWIYPYGDSNRRFHLQHVHLFASNLDASVKFYEYWFDAKVIYDGETAGARNVFMKIGIGALHFYDQPPKGLGKNAVHHLGMQVVGLDELYNRMKDEGLNLPNPIRRFGRQANSGGYFMLEAPDGVLLEVFEPGISKFEAVRDYYGFAEASPPSLSYGIYKTYLKQRASFKFGPRPLLQTLMARFAALFVGQGLRVPSSAPRNSFLGRLFHIITQCL